MPQSPDSGPQHMEGDLRTRRLNKSTRHSENEAICTWVCSSNPSAWLLGHSPCLTHAWVPSITHLQLNNHLSAGSEMKEAQRSQVPSSTRQSQMQGARSPGKARVGAGGQQAEDLKRYVTVPSKDLAHV